jgi:hypothetical protein
MTRQRGLVAAVSAKSLICRSVRLAAIEGRVVSRRRNSRAVPRLRASETKEAAAFRQVRGIPGSRAVASDAADLVAVSDHRATFSARPIAARRITGRSRTIRVRSLQLVVHVRKDEISVLVERVSATEPVPRTVQVLEVGSNLRPFAVEPGTMSNAIACIDRRVPGVGCRLR